MLFLKYLTGLMGLHLKRAFSQKNGNIPFTDTILQFINKVQVFKGGEGGGKYYIITMLCMILTAYTGPSQVLGAMF